MNRPEEDRHRAGLPHGPASRPEAAPRTAGVAARLVGMTLDLKLGVRMLIRYPGLTLVAILALSVAIGGGAAYLEFVNDLYRPSLPVRDGDRLVGIYNQDVARGTADLHQLHDFAAWREEVKSIEGIGAFQPLSRNLITSDGRTEPVQGIEISASAFRLIPVLPLLGRPLVEDDEAPGAPPVAVLGHSLWRSRFGGDPGVVGRTIRLGDGVFTVVGVMPEEFGFPVNHDLWLPLRLNAAEVPRGEGPALRVFGRLAPGVGIEAAQAELDAAGRRAAAAFPQTNQHLRPQVRPYVESLWSTQPDGVLGMRILYAINVFFVGLLGVCAANVATLVFARTATREGEISVRTALGASRGRITAQIFAEALVLAAAAAAVGLAAASFGLRWVKASSLLGGGGDPPFWSNDALSPATLLYAGALTILTALIVGIVPAMKATGPRLQARLKRAATGDAGMKFGGLWTGVIVTQVALTVMFLLIVVTVGWNVYSGRFGTVEYVFPTREYVSARLEMDGEAATQAGRAEFRDRFQATFRELERRLASEPAVVDVTYATHLPGMGLPTLSIDVDGLPPPPQDGGAYLTKTSSVAADFFEAFGAPAVRGRALEPGDVEFGRKVVVVDQTFARELLGGRDPIGMRIRQAGIEGEETGEWYQIVGVVRTLAVGNDEAGMDPVLYRPAAPGDAYPLQLAVRVRGDAGALGPRIRAVAAEVAPTLRVYDLMPMDQLGREDRRALGLWGRILALVGAVALLLSTAGVYSLMSFTVTRRTREIGIRAAVGASPRQILAAVFTPALLQVGLGIVAGSIPGSLMVALGLPEVADGGGLALGIAAFLGIGAFMLAVALVACAVPARRALQVQPTEALRSAG